MCFLGVVMTCMVRDERSQDSISLHSHCLENPHILGPVQVSRIRRYVPRLRFVAVDLWVSAHIIRSEPILNYLKISTPPSFSVCDRRSQWVRASAAKKKSATWGNVWASIWGRCCIQSHRQ